MGRTLLALTVVVLLLVVACAQMPAPTARSTSTPEPTSFDVAVTLEAAPSASQPAHTPPAALSPTPPALSSTPVTVPSPAAASLPSPTPASASRLPAFLREFSIGLPAGNSYLPQALAFHPGLGMLYARTRGLAWDAPGTVTLLDPATGQVRAVAATGSDPSGEGALLLDPRRDRVYALNPGDHTCSVLDAKTLAPVGILDGVEALALDPEAGRLYLAGQGLLRVLDAASQRSLDQVALNVGEVLAAAVDPVAGLLYFAHEAGNGYALTRFDVTLLQRLGSIPLSGRPSALLADPDGGRAYLVTTGEDNLLWTIAADGRITEQRVLGEWSDTGFLALDRAGKRLFLNREASDDYGIAVFDLQTGEQVAKIPLEYAPRGLAWDEATGRLAVSHTYRHAISLLDASTGALLATYPTAITLVDLAVDPGRGHVYTTDSSGQLRVLSGETDRELARLPGDGLLSLDIPHGRVYTGGGEKRRVRVFDADALQQLAEIATPARPVADPHSGGLYLVNQGIYVASLESLTITAAISDTLPQHPGYGSPTAVDAAVDPGSGRIFATVSNGIPGSNAGTYLYVYDPVTFQRVLTDVERSPSFLDIDPASGRAYVSRVHLAGRSTSLLENGRNYTARVDALFGALRLDPGLGLVYVSVYGTDHGELMVLDAQTLDVLDAVPIPSGLTLRALDSRRHWLYLANDDGLIQVWSAMGGHPVPAADPASADLAAAQPSRLFLPPSGPLLYALDGAQRLYRSDDGGTSWGRLGGGLPDEWIWDLVFSPAWTADVTLFAAVDTAEQGFGIWRSTDAGRSWRMVSRGLTDLATVQLAISPAFALDQTLFAFSRWGGLYRCTNALDDTAAGPVWEPLTGRYRPADALAQPWGNLVLSPNYGEDGVLLVEHYGLHLSADGGDTWQEVGWRTESYGTGYPVLGPEVAAGGSLFLLWVPGQPEVVMQVFGSGDRGKTWRLAGNGPRLSGDGSARSVLTPDGLLYLFWTPYNRDLPTQLFRSARPLSLTTSAGLAWERPATRLPQVATPIELGRESDAFMALDASAHLVRWLLAELRWEGDTPGP